MTRLVFVMEQTLGHAAHCRNLERALALRRDLEPTLVRVEYRSAARLQRLPVLRSWSCRASWAARQALRRRLNAGPVDAAFIHTQVAALLAGGAMRKVPTVVSLDATPENFDSQGEAYGHSLQPAVLELFKRAVNRSVLTRAAAVVTWSHWARDSLIRRYRVPAARVTVVRPGVDLDLFRPAGQRPPRGRVRVLFVGGDLERKGGLDLLEAVHGLGHRVELDLVTGAPVPSLPEGVTCRVHRDLAPGSAALVELYRAADIFALPSRGDCLPQVVAEAMACALPVVTTNVGAIPEMVCDGFNGFLVPPRSPRALRQALQTLTADPALRLAMGERGLELARREHDARANWEAIFKIMSALAGQRKVKAA